ncbi:hypothetical protein VOLCADRAFT_105474 [Volvox carteri f. nagariensis]|uniref:Uncharacterized protein n=1 Tax=Volvox carteri f. nagariensis TaxID=3068 RepID=D8U121_VOLCA|nr:uncharacterized protein VOLCADRAFT_105474 [Volvox carteri f. nagariensis]EFJ46556.1 hypothetical protein VOLCADRAFT_105474 [Volvox carteri f. nagariensis]|eukprot:XP_002952413.1 hypothetical protein VOLCADRAFT_105474 [Volvox carteri f. nagariensis]
MCRVLLRHGAKPDFDLDRVPGTAAASAAANTGPWGGSALHRAAALLGRGAAATDGPVRGRSPDPKRLAATVTILLEGGADPCRVNRAGLTALDILLGVEPPGCYLDPADRADPAFVGSGGGGGGRGCFRGLGMFRRPGKGGGSRGSGCSHRAAALRRMLATVATGSTTARIVAASVQVAPFRDCDWRLVWLVVLPRRYGGVFVQRAADPDTGASSPRRCPRATSGDHGHTACGSKEVDNFELLGLSCDPWSGTASVRPLLRLPLSTGLDVEVCDVASMTVRLIFPAGSTEARARLERTLPPQALACARRWDRQTAPQTVDISPGGDGPGLSPLLPRQAGSVTAAAAADAVVMPVAVHLRHPADATVAQRADLRDWLGQLARVFGNPARPPKLLSTPGIESGPTSRSSGLQALGGTATATAPSQAQGPVRAAVVTDAGEAVGDDDGGDDDDDDDDDQRQQRQDTRLGLQPVANASANGTLQGMWSRRGLAGSSSTCTPGGLASRSGAVHTQEAKERLALRSGRTSSSSSTFSSTAAVAAAAAALAGDVVRQGDDEGDGPASAEGLAAAADSEIRPEGVLVPGNDVRSQAQQRRSRLQHHHHQQQQQQGRQPQAQSAAIDQLRQQLQRQHPGTRLLCPFCRQPVEEVCIPNFRMSNNYNYNDE